MTSNDQSGASAMRRFRHKKRGTTYRVLGVGQIQSDAPLTDSEYVVVYQSELQGHLWARRLSEFEDGRFEEIPADPVSSEGADEKLAAMAFELRSEIARIQNARDTEIAALRAALKWTFSNLTEYAWRQLQVNPKTKYIRDAWELLKNE